MSSSEISIVSVMSFSMPSTYTLIYESTAFDSIVNVFSYFFHSSFLAAVTDMCAVPTSSMCMLPSVSMAAMFSLSDEYTMSV